jgi:uncharacterized membrane protein YfcA
VAMQMAVATSLATMLFSSLSSVIAQHRRKAILWEVVRSMLPGLLGGALLGSIIAHQMNNALLGTIFGGFALIVGLQLLFGSRHEGSKPLPGHLRSSSTGFVIGTISSLIGIGGGSMTVPWLLWHGQRVQNAVATSAACGYPIAVAGTLGFILLGESSLSSQALGYVHLPALAGVAIFSVAGAPLGVAAIHRSSPLVAKRVFAAFLIAVAIRMFLI